MSPTETPHCSCWLYHVQRCRGRMIEQVNNCSQRSLTVKGRSVTDIDRFHSGVTRRVLCVIDRGAMEIRSFRI